MRSSRFPNRQIAELTESSQVYVADLCVIAGELIPSLHNAYYAN